MLMSQVMDDGLNLFLTFHPQVKPLLFWDFSKKQSRLLGACRSVMRPIAKYFSMFSEAVYTTCGILSGNYVAHCLLCCHVKMHLHA